MDTKKPLYGTLIGLFLWVVALFTPGWYLFKTTSSEGEESTVSLSIFYTVTSTSDKTFRFDLSIIDIQLAGVLALVLCGVGCRTIWVHIRIRPLNSQKIVIGGVLGLIAATFELVLLARFSSVHLQVHETICPMCIPYSIIIAGLGFLVVLLSVMAILIHYIRPQEQTENNQLITVERRMVKTKAIPLALLFGMVFRIVAFATPGWILFDKGETSYGIFYSRTCTEDMCWTTPSLDNNGLWIDLWVNSVLDVLLSGAGCLILFLRSKMVHRHVTLRVTTCIRGGLFLCVGVTLECTLIIRFIGLNILSFRRSLGVPYSIFLACLAFALHLFSTVMILIRYNRASEEVLNVEEMTDNPSWMTDNLDVTRDNPDMVTYNPDVMIENPEETTCNSGIITDISGTMTLNTGNSVVANII